MQDIIVVIILIVLAFIGVVLVGRKSSQRRAKLLDEIDSIEPKQENNDAFSSLFSQELQQQQRDNEHFEIDADPQITLSENSLASAQENEPSINITLDDDDVNVQEETTPIVTVISEPEELINDVSPPINTNEIEAEMVIAFTVMSRDNTLFSGRSIKIALESLDLHFGDMQLYHRTLPGLGKQTLFSVANVLEPGTLNPESCATMNTPGLLIFSRLPRVTNGLSLFDELLDTAKKMTDKLGGVLSDESRQPISQSSIEAMRGRILTFNLQIQAEQTNHHNEY